MKVVLTTVFRFWKLYVSLTVLVFASSVQIIKNIQTTNKLYQNSFWNMWLIPLDQVTYTSLLSAPQSKNAVSTTIKHGRYIYLMSIFLSIHFHTKRLYVHLFDIVDTPFSYRRGLIVCSSLPEFSKTKESTLQVIWNVDTAFLLCGADLLNNLLTCHCWLSPICASVIHNDILV